MSIEQLMSKDASSAAKLIEDLKIKDRDETICRYPTCREPRQVSAGTGRPSTYCGNPEHTAVSSHRARQQLRALANGQESEKQEPREGATVESLKTSVIAHMNQLQGDMQRYIDTLKTLTDPDLSAARIAEAQQAASAERALRFAADSATLAAQEDARAERDAAEAAIHRMEEAEALLQRQIQEADQQIQEIQTERDKTVAQVQAEMQRQLAEMDKQTKTALAQAREEVKQALTHAHDVEMVAHAQAQAAEQRLAETRANLERERNEIDQLRAERESERSEARANLERERAEARANLERERNEVDRLRTELTAERARADNFALLINELQKQIIESAKKETQEPEQRS